MPTTVYLAAAVEGDVDDAVLRRILAPLNATPHAVYGKFGKNYLREKLDAYNQAAQFSPWVVLRDLNHDAECAPMLKQALLPRPAPQMCFRIVVREIESWLMADAERLSEFLGVGLNRVPGNPEALRNPKQDMVNLARQSRKRYVREDMVPRPGSGRAVGPAYSSRLIDFASNHWRPRSAERRAASLRKCRERLQELIAQVT